VRNFQDLLKCMVDFPPKRDFAAKHVLGAETEG
jgi:hypothetical protein